MPNKEEQLTSNFMKGWFGEVFEEETPIFSHEQTLVCMVPSNILLYDRDVKSLINCTMSASFLEILKWRFVAVFDKLFNV